MLKTNNPCSPETLKILTGHHVLFPGLPEHDKNQKTETVKVRTLQISIINKAIFNKLKLNIWIIKIISHINTPHPHIYNII